jgi:IS605 OrfB family transposase
LTVEGEVFKTGIRSGSKNNPLLRAITVYQKTGFKTPSKVHQEITDARKDHLHKLTTRLVRENQTIAVEDLVVKNRVKNQKLALAISDASWGELVRQLEYKCDWYDRTLIKIDRWFPSSKRCFECGYIVEKLPLNIREWDCLFLSPKCGTHHNRDINAAKNILAALLAVSVCGATAQVKARFIKGFRRLLTPMPLPLSLSPSSFATAPNAVGSQENRSQPDKNF